MSNKGVVKVILGDNVYECLCTYSPETPDTMYRSNGDPGDPGDPEEFELLEVELAFSPTVFVAAPVLAYLLRPLLTHPE